MYCLDLIIWKNIRLQVIKCPENQMNVKVFSVWSDNGSQTHSYFIKVIMCQGCAVVAFKWPKINIHAALRGCNYWITSPWIPTVGMRHRLKRHDHCLRLWFNRILHSTENSFSSSGGNGGTTGIIYNPWLTVCHQKTTCKIRELLFYFFVPILRKKKA